MKSEGILIPLMFAFILAVAIYTSSYSLIEHRRARDGPWVVTFTNDASGAAALVVNEPKLAVTNVAIVFARQARTNSGQTLVFDRPQAVPYPVPYGSNIFMDTTFLPGTVVFDLFGHEIQLIPRVLTIDKKEMPWHSGQTITLE